MKFKIICCIVTPTVREVKEGLVATLHITSDTIDTLQQPHLEKQLQVHRNTVRAGNKSGLLELHTALFE